MYISKVTTFQFRNLTDATISLSSGPVFVTGKNGNGKTNLVEAIYLLSGSKSFRTNTNSECTRWNLESSSIFGTVTRQGEETELGIVFESGSRKALINRNPVDSFSDFIGRATFISFSPNDLPIVKGTPSVRRSLLDKHIVDVNPKYLSALISYQRALANKSSLLKQPGITRETLEPWNIILAEHAEMIARERVNFTARLQNSSQKHHELFAQVDGTLALELESDFVTDDNSVPATKEVIFSMLSNNAQREINNRYVSIGSQRDDLKITIGGVDARPYGSQGQARSIVLALKLGVIDLVREAINDEPIVLLDDVDSELDSERGTKLFDLLLSRERQILVTGTGAPPYSMANRKECQILRVEGGVVTA